MNIKDIIAGYDLEKITIACLGGHSALDVCAGAKKSGLRTLVVAAAGREQTYARHYKTRPDPYEEGEIGVVDSVLAVDKFSDILAARHQAELRRQNAIFVHNRYFWVYFPDFSLIENDFAVPIYGSRSLLGKEERGAAGGDQYELLAKAGIRSPHRFASPAAIDRLVLVKVNEAARGYERAFFVANSPADYELKAEELLARGVVTEEALNKATIEEYVLGAQVNFNYFFSPLTGELELLGTDTRRQTDLDGFLRLPATEQLEILRYRQPKMIETGHVAVTVKESLLEKIFAIGERFVAATKTASPPGIIGPFALQGAVVTEDGREDLVIFDVSLRIPGSPGTRFTPYSAYLRHRSLSYGERIALEIKTALRSGRLAEILT